MSPVGWLPWVISEVLVSAFRAPVPVVRVSGVATHSGLSSRVPPVTTVTSIATISGLPSIATKMRRARARSVVFAIPITVVWSPERKAVN